MKHLLFLLFAILSFTACEGDKSSDLPDGDGDLDGELDSEFDVDGDEELDAEEESESEVEDADVSEPNILAMTFNLRLGVAQDGPDSWEERRDLVCDLIARRMPAVMGVQEAWKFQMDYIMEKVPGFEWVGISRSDYEGFDEYSAVFFRTDRFKLIETATFWLSDTPEEPGSVFSEEQLVKRIVTWAELQSLATGRRIFIFNTHFDTSDADQIPQRSAALLVRRIAAIAGDHPVILTGDFNELVGSDAYRILTGDMEFEGVRGQLVDPWVMLDLPEEGTFHGFTGNSAHDSRIDWILASEDLLPLAGAVLHDNEEGRYPSDHFPVEVEYGW